MKKFQSKLLTIFLMQDTKKLSFSITFKDDNGKCKIYEFNKNGIPLNNAEYRRNKKRNFKDVLGDLLNNYTSSPPVPLHIQVDDKIFNEYNDTLTYDNPFSFNNLDEAPSYDFDIAQETDFNKEAFI